MFLIQTGEDGQVLFDFQHELLERLRINKWMYDDASNVLLAQSFKNFSKPENELVCPVGSLEFVSGYIQKYYGDVGLKNRIPMRPINVPTQLANEEFAGRFIKKYVTLQEVLSILNNNPESNYYVKSSLQIKDKLRFCYKGNAISAFAGVSEGDRFDISEDVGIIRAEWRAFIYDNEILDVRRYVGDWSARLDPKFIDAAVHKWITKPRACTLDVALTETGRFIVMEGHNFVSCGTYGFNDQKLPRMFMEGFKWEISM